jgi:hypothetical protein
MSKRHFHINYEPPAQWVLSIMSPVQLSSSPILRQRWQNAAKSGLTELPLALATKFEIMKVTTERLNGHIHELSDDFDARPDEVQRDIIGRDGQPSAYMPLKRTLPFEIVADLDAWIFEMRSTYEILYAFVKEFSSRILDRKVKSEEVLKSILHEKGYNSDWIDFLRRARNLFVHRTAPWFAIEVTGGTLQYEIVVLKRNARNLDNPDDYATMEQFRAVQQGFFEALHALRKWILEEIRKIEARTINPLPRRQSD